MRITRLLLLVVSISLFLAPALGQPSEWIDVQEIHEDRVSFYRYKRGELGEVGIRDLELWTGAVGRDVDRVFSSPSQVRTDLLRRGWAKLRDRTNASNEEVGAEAEARAAGHGLWREEWLRQRRESAQDHAGQVETSQKSLGQRVLQLWAIVWRWVVILGSLGVLVPVVLHLYRRLVYRKRVWLLLVGDSSAGKTALFVRLHDPDISEDEIRNLRTTEAVRRYKDRPLAIGKYEVHPVLYDHPGIVKVAKQIDSLLVPGLRRHLPRAKKVIVIFVASPTEQISLESADDEHDYRQRQVGLIAVLADVTAMSKYTRKPDAMVLFLNKFDLFSVDPPNDSASADARARFTNLFRQHNEIVEAKADSARIRYKLAIGSTLKGWGVEEVRKTVERVLYGR